MLQRSASKGTNSRGRRIPALVRPSQLDLLNLTAINIHDGAPKSVVPHTSTLASIFHHLQIIVSLLDGAVELVAHKHGEIVGREILRPGLAGMPCVEILQKPQYAVARVAEGRPDRVDVHVGEDHADLARGKQLLSAGGVVLESIVAQRDLATEQRAFDAVGLRPEDRQPILADSAAQLVGEDGKKMAASPTAFASAG